MKYLLIVLLLLTASCSLVRFHDTTDCTSSEPTRASWLMNSMKSGNVEYFLANWAASNRPTAVTVHNYMPPPSVTITKIQWVGSCNNYKGTISFYVVSLSSDYNSYDSDVTIQTNTEGMVISEE